ncbi:MAG: hypothetical protein IJ587_01345 [Synergistaceae bacterium]|nr:hypothetical protein [Synergistaceae bacterium]
MMKPEIKICVSLTDEVLIKIKSRIESEKHEELIRPVLYEVAKMLETSGKPKKVKVSEFIREHIDDLVREYAAEYPLWEARVLKYAKEHKHGVSHQLIEVIYYDKIWNKKFPEANGDE